MIKPEFDRRGVKIIGLSVDPVENHEQWARDIAETKLYGMLPADTAGDPTRRTPAENQTVRTVFVIGPDRGSSSASPTR